VKLLPPAIAAVAIVFSAVVFAAPALAQDPCRPGFTLGSGILCIPDPNYTPPAQAAPAPPAAPQRSILDRILGRNRPAPVTPAPGQPPAPEQPARPAPFAPAPAPPPPAYTQPTQPAPSDPPPVGGGDVLGPVQLLPGGGTCSPGLVINVLGDTYVCPPSGQVPTPQEIFYVPTTPGQPPAAGSNIQSSGPQVTG